MALYLYWGASFSVGITRTRSTLGERFPKLLAVLGLQLALSRQEAEGQLRVSAREDFPNNGSVP